MKNIKILLHIMPWEISHYLLVIDKLKQSSYFLDHDDNIYIDTTLNLSDGVIDWGKSKLPKEYFVEQFNTANKLLENTNFILNSTIYEGDKIYGHLDLQKSSYQENIDYYITICPDISFNEYLLYYLIESAKQIDQENFIITPEIFKSWDSSWDVLVNEKYKDIPYTECINHDIHKIHHLNINNDNISIEKINGFKFAGWFDLFSKNTYEKIFRIPDEWHGYGPWDLYALNICYTLKNLKQDITQYKIKGSLVWFYDTGCLQNKEEYGTDGQLKLSIKKFLSIKKDRKSQRVDIDLNMEQYLRNWVEYAKQNKLI